MDENRYYYKHNTYTSNVSDDSSISSCGIPLPATFYTEARRRRSRLGKHITRNRVLQDLNQNPEYIQQTNDDESDDRLNSHQNIITSNFIESHDSFSKPLELQDASFVKNSHQNIITSNFIESHDSFSKPLDIQDASFVKINSPEISFSKSIDMYQDTFSKPSTTHLTSNSTTDSNKIPKLLNFTLDSPKSVTPCTSIQIESIVPIPFISPMEPQPMTIDHSPQPEPQSIKIDCLSESEPVPIKIDHSSESLQSSNSSKESVNPSNEKRPIEVEFKRPESPPPPSKEDKNDFRFEPPLPVPPNPKSSERLPPFITVKGKSYSVVNILGSGGSSLVYQVLHPENNETLAIKRVNLSEVDETIAEGYIDEVKLLKSLQKSEFIIKMFDHEIIYENDKKLLLVVMEKGDTDLSELIRNINKTKKLSILMILYYWHEMLSAVFEIHNSGIIHSDLKPANFLLVKGRLKLIDFGIASSIQGDMTSVYKDVFTGTLNYMSPEAVQFVNCSSGSIGYKITYKTDVWSLGCILYNLIYGRLPFQHLKKKWDKMRAIVDPNIQVDFPEVKSVPSVLMLALKSCLDKDPKKRLSVKELLQLPYCGN